MTRLNDHRLTFVVLPDQFAVCRLDPVSPIPAWASAGTFTSITRTPDELSIVCPQSAVPDAERCERAWRGLRIQGTLDFSLIGVVATFSRTLSEAGIGVLVLSTFDTDYVLVKEIDLVKAVAALRAAGHAVELQTQR